MKICYKKWSPSSGTLVYMDEIQDVIEQYDKLGYKLTLRQLYYQLVTKDIIPNTQAEYTKLGNVLKNARMSGRVDWDIIEDRIREAKKKPDWKDTTSFLDAVIPQYRLPRHLGQKYHVELWCEKDALSSILLPITREYHINLMVNRGYSSASAMFESSKRLLEAHHKYGQTPVIIYLGDHDPSGLDMDRDIKERLKEFQTPVSFARIGLTKNQINKYNPPPNPAKFKDPRATDYIRKHGRVSWEVDALPPNILDELVRDSIEELLDMSKYEAIKEMEIEAHRRLREVVKDEFKNLNLDGEIDELRKDTVKKEGWKFSDLLSDNKDSERKV